jgi:alcohol dehydrogenase (quinone), cytochrome c subunit
MCIVLKRSGRRLAAAGAPVSSACHVYRQPASTVLKDSVKTAGKFCVVSLMLLAACHREAVDGGARQPDSPPTAMVTGEVREEGRYLANAGDCISCHTRPGGPPFAGGVAFETPIGVVYSSNITPDNDTGIGRWTEADLRRAMQEGVAADGHRLYPAFPYTSFTRVTDQDINAVYSYLRTVQSVRYVTPTNGLLFRQRWALMFWDLLFFEPGRYQLDPARSAEWNRGAYLVEGLGHCGACHTPRNSLMAESGVPYSGGEIQERVTQGKIGWWSSVNLTPSPSGLGRWSAEDIANYLKVGFTQRGATFGPMNDVIVNGTRKLSAEDLRAIAAYLKSLPAWNPNTQPRPPLGVLGAGKKLYTDHCEKCHLTSGRGSLFGGPRLAGSALVQVLDPASLINVVLYGPDPPTSELGDFGSWETMKAYNTILSDAEIGAVCTYIRNSWGNAGSVVTAGEVARQR